MAIPGSETYKSVTEPETLPRDTHPSEGASPPTVIQGDDWPLKLVGLNPEAMYVTDSPRTFAAHGGKFDESTVIVFNHKDVETTFVNEGKVTMHLDPSLEEGEFPLTVPVKVRNGVVSSNELAFTYNASAVIRRDSKKHGKHV